ncbi:MAG: DUF1800 domain-containing protein [Acidobacteriota bacterium]
MFLRILRSGLGLVLSASALLLASSAWGSPPGALTEREKALHVLNRLAFGPRPGDVDRVLRIGIRPWIEAQLRPESLPDSQLPARLASLETLSMAQSEIFDRFEKPLREARERRKLAAAAASPTVNGEAQASGAGNDAREDMARLPPEQRPRRLVAELATAKVLRAAFSERQLNEVMVDFWMNHFNVYAAKGLDRVLLTSFERDTIRPRIWGRFEDLLLATAKSPAMLFYLDNARSVADPEHRPAARRSFRREPSPASAGTPETARAAKGGLNENYARELMELHTLGVDGGYTQKDVTELARVLTGWSMERAASGEFTFRPRAHDAGSKTVLGHVFAAGGMDEGEAMIRILARHPATARHLARKLCERLVSDDPPDALIARVAARSLASGGDLRETVRAVVESSEFFDPAFFQAKVKSPFEYVVSAVRASGSSTDAGRPLLKQIEQMGEPLYLCQPPTGYSDAAAAWVNSGAIVARLNFALALASNRIPGTDVDLSRLLSPAESEDPARAADALARGLLGRDLSPETRSTIARRLQERAAAGEGAEASPLSLVAALVIGSPEFQRQ